MRDFTQDFWYAARSLRRAPGFAFVAVAALALGIGATSAVFGIVHAVLLQPLPFPDSGRIVTPISTHAGRGIRDGGVAYADYQDWREQAGVFAAVALWRPQSGDLTGGERPERVAALAVTGEFFTVLGVAAVRGRTFDDTAQEGDRPAVLSHAAWQRLFGGEASAVGRTIYLAGVPHTIVGILPDAQVWPRQTDLFVPLILSPGSDLQRRDNFVYRVIARLQPGVDIEAARARLAAMAATIETRFPESRAGWSYDVVTLHAYTVGDELRSGLLMLVGAVGLVLLIACANVANLLLARGMERRRELAVRAALGATRGRLMRVLMAESLLMAAAGGVAGVLLGYWLSRLLVWVAPPQLPSVAPMHLDWQVVAFTLAVSLGTAVLFGLAPALAGGLVRPNDALKDAQRGTTAGTGRTRDVIVVAELALAVVLLVSAGLLIRSLVAAGQIDPGVEVQNVLGARISVPGARYPEPERRAAFYEELLGRISAQPGVRSAAVTSRLPAGGPGFGLGRVFLSETQPEPPASSDHPAQWTVVSPGYFETLGLRLLDGRVLDARDRQDGVPVIVISEALARAMFPGESAVGKRIRSWRDENRLREVVGVVGDVRYFALADRPRAAVYVPHAQDPWGGMMLAVKTHGDPLALTAVIRQEVTAMDPLMALGDVGALDSFSAASIGRERFLARLLGGFAALALLLAAIGVYGVMSVVVSRRLHEMGVRIALGATPWRVGALVIGTGLWRAGLGLVIGLAGAAALGQVMRGMLHEIGPADPLAFAAAPAVLLVASLAACLVPAWRAARVDPVVALRD